MHKIVLPFEYNLKNSVIEILGRLPKDEILVYGFENDTFYFSKDGKLFWIRQTSKKCLETNDKKEALKILNLNKNYKEFFDIIKKDKFLLNIYNKTGFITLPRTTNPFEIFVRAIIEQQISYNLAVNIQNKLIKKYGIKKQNVDRICYSFPKPEMLINADLRSMGVSKRKEEYIKGICKEVLNGNLDLNILENIKREEVFEILLPFKGIGRWSIEHIMLRGYGRYEFIPYQDLFFKRLCRENKIKNLDDFGKWKGLVGYYLIVYYNWTC